MIRARGVRAALAGAWVAAASAWLYGCPPCGGGAYLDTVAQWDFEGDCAGDARCGFAVERGSASIRAAFHPGEHGLSIGPSSSVVAAVRDASQVEWVGAPQVRLVARCDAGTRLTVTVETAARASSFAGDGGPGGEGALESTLATSERWAAAATAFSTAGEVGEVRGVRFATSGPGACAIDAVRVLRAGYGGFCE